MQPITNSATHVNFSDTLARPVALAFSQEIEAIDSHLKAAQVACGDNLMSTRIKAYEDAFKIFCAVANQHGALPADLKSKFYELLFNYASHILYNQGQNGFRDCACLMKFSLLLQCADMNVLHADSSWPQANNIKDLVSSILSQGDEALYHLDFIDPTYVELISGCLESNPEIRKTFSEALVKLAYSFQNMPPLKDRQRNADFHKNLNEMAFKAIGCDTAEQLDAHVDFLYNRCSFTAGLNFENPFSQECIEAKIHSYNPLEQLYFKNYGPHSTKYLAKFSQIENMRGLLTMKIPNYSHDKALQHFRSAINYRMQIPQPEGVEGQWENLYLLNNVRTGLIHELLLQPTAENILEASQHAASMAEFIASNIKEGRNPNYNSSYLATMAKMANFLPK